MHVLFLFVETAAMQCVHGLRLLMRAEFHSRSVCRIVKNSRLESETLVTKSLCFWDRGQRRDIDSLV